MITVNIDINGHTIYSRTATRVADPGQDGNARYHIDTGKFLRYNPEKGAVKLAIKMLKTIKETTDDNIKDSGGAD